MDETGPIRREDFLGSEEIAALLKAPDSLEAAPILALAGQRFGALAVPKTRLLLLAPGEAPEPLLPDGAKAGFLLDLDPPDWRSEWGGLLLFQDVDGRVHGYRPVPGALTVFGVSDRPLISAITPAGGRRTSVLGWWN